MISAIKNAKCGSRLLQIKGYNREHRGDRSKIKNSNNLNALIEHGLGQRSRGNLTKSMP
jgi:hypothetical protein